MQLFECAFVYVHVVGPELWLQPTQKAMAMAEVKDTRFSAQCAFEKQMYSAQCALFRVQGNARLEYREIRQRSRNTRLEYREIRV